MSGQGRVRTGVVGVGHIGRNHARIYGELAQSEFVAVLETDPRAAADAVRRHGVVACASIEEFAEKVDAASIATPTVHHHAVARELLLRGKHLLIEKPIAETLEQARELVELAAAHGCVLQVGHVERFNPVLAALEERLTRPRFIEAHRLSPYPGRSTDIGVVLDLMIHDLEVILHLVRSPVESLDAVGIPVLSRTEDIANARIRFADGCVANITASRISPDRMRKIRVFQEDAYLSLDYGDQTGDIYRKTPGGITRERVPIERDEPLVREIRSFVECAASGRRPTVTGQEAADALDLALRITALIERGGGRDASA